MNAWSALVLIAMTLVVGFVAYLTSSPWALLGLTFVGLLGERILEKGPRQI